MHRVVVTGLGTINPLGNHVKDSWERVKNAENGLSVNFGGFGNNVVSFVLRRAQS